MTVDFDEFEGNFADGLEDGLGLDDAEEEYHDGYEADEDNPYGITMYPVDTPSGGMVKLLSTEEQQRYVDNRDTYMSQNKFTNQSDLNDLDRVLLMETMILRWSTWLSQGFDYQMSRVDEKSLQRQIADYSKELRLVKKSLSLDKATRDKLKGDSVGDFIQELLQRAKEFGIHRNHQYEEAVTMIYQLKTLVGTYDRCDEEEREDLDLSQESILEWIRENMIERWDEIDQAFRDEQKMWIRSLQ